MLLPGLTIPMVALVSPAAGADSGKDLPHPSTQKSCADILRGFQFPLRHEGHRSQSCSRQRRRNGIAEEFQGLEDVFREDGFPWEPLGHEEFPGQ
eukprot:16355495-Heterocapsa_arctica.AAC.1